MSVRHLIASLGCVVVACGGGGTAVRPDCAAGQTSLDGTCVSQAVADYVGCIRATGASVATDNSRSLSAAAGAAGVTAATQADVRDKLEKRYATVSDANAQEIIRRCDEKTAGLAGRRRAFSGFAQYWKCDDDNVSVGDKRSKEDCLAACQAQPNAGGCWYLDGTGGFARDCRVCRTTKPHKDTFANDWAGSFD